VKISSHGERVKVVRLAGKELEIVLKAKAIEEALELYWAESSDSVKEELVDISEVLNALKELVGLSNDDFNRLAEKKRAERGGFQEGFVLKETREVPLIEPQPENISLFRNMEREQDIGIEYSSPVRSQRGPKLKGPRIIVPMIPPNPDRRHVSYTFQTKDPEVLVNIRFLEKDIVIEIGRVPPKKPPRDSQQLLLFDL